MKLTREQVIAWAREAGVHEQWFNGNDCPPIVFRLAALAYEAGRKDEREGNHCGDPDCGVCL